MSAFAGGVMRIVPQNHLQVRPIFPIDPPTPTPTPTVSPTSTAVDAERKPDLAVPQHPIDLGGAADGDIVLPTGPFIDQLPGGKIALTPLPLPLPLPSPSPGFAPVGARPLGRPGLWVTNSDYPAGAMRRGEQGVTGFRVTVGADGRVRDCVVTRSSGSDELDRATCAKVSMRAKFAPASDSNGNPVAGSYANTIRWEIPN